MKQDSIHFKIYLLLSYKKQTNKQTKTKQKTFNLTYLIWKEKKNIKETRLSRANDMLLSIFHFSRFHGLSVLN